ncbi:uncharacterized protein LOC135839114 [Planococcus citri]|uniref:uncharacterized protein LOC135839114 n=1 Tax=Planococcus citri TaxID=170843 RepID=UPI0031F79B0B
MSTDISVGGLGGKNAAVNQCVDVTIISRYNSSEITVRCLVVENIVSSVVPNQFFEINSWNLPSHLYLADPYFNIPDDIDILLGLDIFWKILKSENFNLGANLPKLKETELGWIIAGSFRTAETTQGTMVFILQLSNNELLNQMKKFWSIEHQISNFPLTADELACEAIYQKTTYRQSDGRFVVSLPFKKDPALLGQSRFEALKQFMHLEKRLKNNPQMKEKYVSCMNEYIELGHMVEISENLESNSAPKHVYYVPHHAVINPSSTSTSQRTVFNASMKTSSGVSLNDLLYTGPVVQPKLRGILTRFRLYAYVMTADIVKMYRQIRRNPDHTAYQRIFWRNSPEEKLKVCELTTVTFGERSAQYEATRTLKKLAEDYGANFPNAKSAILSDFYVDNLLTGSNSLEQAKATQEELIALLNSAGLPLSKWSSNSPELLSKIDPLKIEPMSRVSFDDKEMVKTLGMYWAPCDDTLRFWFEKPNVTEARTKRQILGIIASIYDPMGLVGPITVTAKCFMQEIWKFIVEDEKRKIYWDETVPDKILRPWREFAAQLHLLNKISIPRHITPSNTSIIYELHGFSDASSRAYGAVLYLRAISGKEVQVHLLCSKSRVAPLKEISIPRMELLAAELLAEMAHEVALDLSVRVNIASIRLWSDSKIALSWIGTQSYKWSVFVAHRVTKIQSLSKNSQWDYVESTSNPADVLSRGANPIDLCKPNHVWFFGPTWLRNSTSPWPDFLNFVPNPNESEERKTERGIAMVATSFRSNLFNLVGLPDTGTNSSKLAHKLGYKSSDPNELNALTPGHFLIGGPITALQTIDYTNIPSNRLKHWEQINKLTQLFWKRWQSEYLNTLQQRYKWQLPGGELKLGDFVVIKDDHLSPTQWALGRVLELHPGKDGPQQNPQTDGSNNIVIADNTEKS